VVDDCSTDGTREILRTSGRQGGGHVIYHERNQGKERRYGREYPVLRRHRPDPGRRPGIRPQEYPKLLAPIMEGKADVVYGSVSPEGNQGGSFSFWHYVGNRFLTTLSNMFTNINLSDMETCYKSSPGRSSGESASRKTVSGSNRRSRESRPMRCESTR